MLDIPVWGFDWQFNYYPAEQTILEPGDIVRTECTRNRSFRDPELKPAYVSRVDSTDDEVCFAAITVCSR